MVPMLSDSTLVSVAGPAMSRLLEERVSFVTCENLRSLRPGRARVRWPAMAIRYASELPNGTGLVVVGGGVIGAATAFHAARAGLRPLLVEARPALCSLTTAVAAGGFRLQQDSERELRLVRESDELFANFEEITGQRDYDPAVRRNGYLWVTRTDDGAERQRRLVATQRSWGLTDVDLLGGDEAQRAFPFLGPEVTHARFRQGDGLIDPKALTFGLAAGACEAGASVAVSCAVVGLRVEGGRVSGVETTRGPIGADAVVVAAGPLSGRVAAMAGLELPVATVRRHKLVMPDVPQVPADAPMTIDEDTGAHWRPAFRGAALLFTDPATRPSPPAEDVPLDHRFVFDLLDPSSPVALARITPFWRDVWEHGAGAWFLQAGQYTMTPDRRPLIGPAGPECVWVNAGYSGHGVMASPAGSSLLLDVIT